MDREPLGAVRAGGSRWIALAILAGAAGGIYLYLSGLNDRIPVETQHEARPAMNGAAPENSSQTVFPTRDATIGRAERAADDADRVNDRLEQALQATEGGP